MTMNLIQIQDKLKSLPNDPRVMQMLTAYANGQSPQVPPYLALGELNRRKGEMERMKMEQAGQPPGGTVKDQIQQQAGVMALKQGQQQQAMQRMAQQGMQGGAPVPQGIPQPQVQAAAGGLASLAPKAYRSGGIIAFKKAGSVDEAVEEDEDEGEDGESTGEYAGDAKAMLAQLMQEATKRRNMNAPTADTPLENRKKMIATDPERYGILNTPVGAEAMKRLDEVQGSRRAELAKQKEELAQSKPGILQLLGQAAMGSRGQQGGSALASILGGYSDLSTTAGAKQLQQEQALRMKELDLQQAKAEAMNKIDDLRRAQAEGDIAGEQKAKMELARIAKEHNVSLNTLLGKQVTAAGSLAGRESAANIAAKAKIAAAKATGNKDKDTDQSRGIAILEADISRKNPEMSPVEVKAEALRQYRLNTPAGAGVVQRTTADAMKALSQFKVMSGKEWKKFVDGFGGDVVAASKAYIDDYKGGVLPPELMPRRPKPAASNAEPSVKPTAKPATGITPAEFDKQWAKLKPGQSLVGPDGETYTKK